MELEEFVKARLDEDEAIAVAAGGDEWVHDSDGLARPGENAFAGCWTDSGLMGFEPEGDHAARHDPARALREVAAKRRMLTDLDLPYPDEAHLLKLLALAWDDHPDYDEAWRP